MEESRCKELLFYERMMVMTPGFDPSNRNVPKCCKQCEYFQPRWKYRFCYYANCQYDLKKKTIRKTPLKKEHFPPKRGGENE